MTKIDEGLQASAGLRFDATDFEKQIVDYVATVASTPSRWRAFNAIRHLSRAKSILATDAQMALFRCITAEEEAATALFLVLKQKQYAGSGRLKPRDHKHKNAVIPFVQAVSRTFARWPEPKPDVNLVYHPATKTFGLTVKFTPDDSRVAFTPPFNFSFTSSSQGKPWTEVTFQDDLQAVATSADAQSIRAYLERRANLRNLILYASDAGFPVVDVRDDESEFLTFKRNVFAILRIYVLVEPFKRQRFIQQCLDSFLSTVSRVPDSAATFD